MAVEDKYLNMEGLQRLVAKLKETYGEAFLELLNRYPGA